MSVAQTDEVIITLHGDKSKMSIYEKPLRRGVSLRGFFGDLAVNFPQADSAAAAEVSQVIKP